MNKLPAKIILALVIGLTTTITASPTLAKDWIEKVDLTKDGIDIKTIDVRANANGYTSVQTNSHKFLLGLYARAESGKRIVAANLSSMNGAEYFEGTDSKEWRKRLNGREVGSGSKATWSRSYHANVPTNKINWVGPNPVQICNNLLQKKKNQGQSKISILSKTWDTTGTAFFQLQAVAARKNKAKNNSWKMQNTTAERKSLNYSVRVRCMPKAKLGYSN